MSIFTGKLLFARLYVLFEGGVTVRIGDCTALECLPQCTTTYAGVLKCNPARTESLIASTSLKKKYKTISGQNKRGVLTGNSFGLSSVNLAVRTAATVRVGVLLDIWWLVHRMRSSNVDLHSRCSCARAPIVGHRKLFEVSLHVCFAFFNFYLKASTGADGVSTLVCARESDGTAYTPEWNRLLPVWKRISRRVCFVWSPELRTCKEFFFLLFFF